MGKVRTRTDSEKKEEKSSGKTVGKLSHETGQKTAHTHMPVGDVVNRGGRGRCGGGGGFNDYHVMVASRPLGSSLSKDPLPSQLHLL